MNTYRHKDIIIFLFSISTLILFACSVDSVDNTNEPVLPQCDFSLYPSNDVIIDSHTEWARTHYPDRIEAFKKDSIYSNSIVMLGNSLTEQGGDWSDRLNINKVKNRGIAGDNSDGVLARLGEIICVKPKSIFIMIGTNDLWTSYSVKKVSENIDKIATTLTEALPETEVYLQTIMPLEKDHPMTTRLDNINQEIKAIQNRDYQLIDTFEHMANNDGYLPSNLTTDGVHLNEAGYNKWVDFLTNYLK